MDNEGKVIAIKNGTAIITVTVDDVSKTCEVTVKKPKILMMHIYNDIIERNDGESENNIIRGGMIMLRVDFTFDKKIIEKNGYTMSNIYETIKMEFDKKNISCVAEGEVLSFGAGEKKNDFSDMWTIIMRLTRSKWFLNYATSCTWNENNKSEDVLAQIKRKQMIST